MLKLRDKPNTATMALDFCIWYLDDGCSRQDCPCGCALALVQQPVDLTDVDGASRSDLICRARGDDARPGSDETTAKKGRSTGATPPEKNESASEVRNRTGISGKTLQLLAMPLTPEHANLSMEAKKKHKPSYISQL